MLAVTTYRIKILLFVVWRKVFFRYNLAFGCLYPIPLETDDYTAAGTVEKSVICGMSPSSNIFEIYNVFLEV